MSLTSAGDISDYGSSECTVYIDNADEDTFEEEINLPMIDDVSMLPLVVPSPLPSSPYFDAGSTEGPSLNDKSLDTATFTSTPEIHRTNMGQMGQHCPNANLKHLLQITTNLAQLSTNLSQPAQYSTNMGQIAKQSNTVGTMTQCDTNLGQLAQHSTNVGQIAQHSTNVGQIAQHTDSTNLGQIAHHSNTVGTMTQNDTNVGQIAQHSTNVEKIAQHSTSVEQIAQHSTGVKEPGTDDVIMIHDSESDSDLEGDPIALGHTTVKNLGSWLNALDRRIRVAQQVISSTFNDEPLRSKDLQSKSTRRKRQKVNVDTTCILIDDDVTSNTPAVPAQADVNSVAQDAVYPAPIHPQNSSQSTLNDSSQSTPNDSSQSTPNDSSQSTPNDPEDTCTQQDVVSSTFQSSTPNRSNKVTDPLDTGKEQSSPQDGNTSNRRKSANKPCPQSKKLSRRYYCSVCRALFSEVHEHERPESEILYQETYCCQFCHKEFTSKNDRAQHSRSCTRRCTCQFCGVIFAEISELRQHLFNEHAPSGNKSSKHKDIFLETQNSDQTKITELSIESERAVEGSENSPPASLKTTEKNKFSCSICGVVLSTEENLHRHKRSHNTDQQTKTVTGTETVKEKEKFPCTLCDVILSTAINLTRHQKSHQTEPQTRSSSSNTMKGKFPCKLCGAVLSTPANVLRHQKSCKTDPPKNITEKVTSTVKVKRKGKFPCTICESVLSTVENLARHQRSLHSDILEAFIKNPNQKSSMMPDTTPDKSKDKSKPSSSAKPESLTNVSPPASKKRKQAELPNKNYKCNKCGILLSCFQNLKRHMRVHGVDLKKDPSIKTLNKSQKSDSMSAKKQAKDSAKARFRCGVCGKVFVHPLNLERHANTHSQTLPYQCQICYAKFARLHYLQGHFEKFHIMDSQ